MGCVNDFFQGKPLLSINQILITLVPKNATASVLSDFRPISYANLIYKLLTKILASKTMEVAGETSQTTLYQLMSSFMDLVEL